VGDLHHRVRRLVRIDRRFSALVGGRAVLGFVGEVGRHATWIMDETRDPATP
jgi:hypothetical protein